MDAERHDPYPSRAGRKSDLLERQDPILYAKERHGAALRPTHIEDYLRHGFVAIRALFSDAEVQLLKEELERLRTERNNSDDESVIFEPGSRVVRSIFRVHKHSRLFDRVSRDSRLLDVARYLLDDDVYLHQTRLNYKPGCGGQAFYWHSDFETWHTEDGMPRMRAVSVSISLTENTEHNGPLMLIPGSHRLFVACAGETPENHYRQSLRRQEYGVPDPASLRRLVETGGIESVRGPAGTVTFFDCNTMHGSNSNITPLPRTNAFFVYNSVSNQLEAPYAAKQPRPGFLAERREIAAISPVSGPLRASHAA